MWEGKYVFVCMIWRGEGSRVWRTWWCLGNISGKAVVGEGHEVLLSNVMMMAK